MPLAFMQEDFLVKYLNDKFWLPSPLKSMAISILLNNGMVKFP